MLLRFLFGDDIFISYAREDGATYAAGLANQLAKQKFSCRFDQWGTRAGKEIPKEMKRALRRSAMLVLIGTPAAAGSDAVHQEVSIFKSTGRDMVPILFDGVGLGEGFIFMNGRKVNSAQVDQSDATSVFKKTEDALWAEDIQGLPLSAEKTDLLITGDPSLAILNRIEKTFQFSRKDERLRQTSKIVAAVVILLIGASVIAASIASMKSAEALTKAAEAAEQQRLAKEAKREADKQTEAAGKAQEEAEKQRQQAVLNKQEADKQQKLAELNKAEAEKQGTVAEQRRREAETQTKISTSRRLASSAFAHLDDALNYSLSLSLDANKSAKTFEARSSLFAVLNHSPQLRSFLKDARKSERGDVAFSPNNKFLVSGGADGALRIWNLETAKLEAPPLTFVKEDYIMALGFSSTGDRLALVLSPKNQDKPEEVDKETAIIILDTKTWQTIGKTFKPGFVVTSVALNNTGEIMALGGMGGYITLWKLESATVNSLGELTDEPYGLSAVTSLVFSGDGNRLASLIVPALWPGETVIELAAKSNLVQLWNVPDKKLITKLPSTLEFALNSIALSTDGQLLAAGTTAGDVVVRDLTSTSKGNQLMRHKDQAVPSTSNAIISLAIGRDKNRIVSVTGGKTLVSWDRSTGTGSNATQLKASLDEFHEATFNLETEQLATFTDGER